MAQQHNRKTEDLDRLTVGVDNPQNDGLLSYTEKIMVAIAAEDQARAPGSLREANGSEWSEAAWSELDDHQRTVIEQYRRTKAAKIQQTDKQKAILLKIGSAAADLSRAVEKWKGRPNEGRRISMYEEIKIIDRLIQQLKRGS